MITLPSYQNFMLKSRRADAKEALGSLQLAHEKWRGNHDTYTNTLTDLGISSTSTAGYYTIALTAGKSTATTFEATIFTGAIAENDINPRVNANIEILIIFISLYFYWLLF